MTTDTAKRVARGVKWLDRHAPGWEERIKLREFDITNPCACVLGQVFAETHGGFDAVLKDLDLLKELPHRPSQPKGVISRQHARVCGFDIPRGALRSAVEARDTFSQLQHEWERVIRERKGGKK